MSRRRILALAASAACLASLTVAPSARADRELLSQPGSKGQLVIDQISGFRASLVNGLTYAGPLGFAHRSYSYDSPAPVNNTNTVKTNTFWITPTADYFIMDRLSIGGLIEFSSTSGTVKTATGPNTTTEGDLPTVTSFTLLPRVGYMIPITDRFAIWPRGGIGYARSAQAAGGGGTQAFSAVVLDLDVGLLYRFNETFFIKGAPQVAFSLGGSQSTEVGNVTNSVDASAFQFSFLTGVGVMFDL